MTREIIRDDIYDCDICKTYEDSTQEGFIISSTEEGELGTICQLCVDLIIKHEL